MFFKQTPRPMNNEPGMSGGGTADIGLKPSDQGDTSQVQQQTQGAGTGDQAKQQLGGQEDTGDGTARETQTA